jgi:hypothetical protein
MQTRGIKFNYKVKQQYYVVVPHYNRKPRGPRRQLLESLQYVVLKMTDFRVESTRMKSHTTELSKSDATYLKSKYNINARFQENTNFLKDFKILNLKLNEIEIVQSEFKLRMFKRRSIEYRMEPENEDEKVKKAIGPTCLTIRLLVKKTNNCKTDSADSDHCANSSLSSLEVWSDLE